MDTQLTSIVLIVANLLVWISTIFLGGSNGFVARLLSLHPEGYCPIAAEKIALIDKARCLAEGYQWVDGVATGAWWQVITTAFTHTEIMHIGFNLMALWFLGPNLERVLGRNRFLAVYLGSATTASAVVMWLSEPYSATLGASGSIFGLLAALLLVVKRHGGEVRTILFWLAASAVITMLDSRSISWQGHLGGFVGGLLITAAIVYAPKKYRRGWQILFTLLVLAVAIGAIVLRAQQLG